MVASVCDRKCKVIIIGEAGSGKSCLLYYFLEGKFRKNSSYTVGVEFGEKIVEIQGKRVKLQMWDTAGQEKYRAVCRSYYRGALGAVIVYDVTRRASFEGIQGWVKDALELGGSNLAILLVGNKSDLKNEREVSFIEGSTFAQEQGLLFVECSALSGENVEEAFGRLTKAVLSKNAEQQKLLELKSQEKIGQSAVCPC